MLLSHVFSDMFDDMFIPSTMSAANAPRLMNSEVREYDDHYELHMELAGFKKEDIKAERSANNDAQNDGGRVIRSERFMGTCQRTFYVGEHVQREDVRAAFEDGVLKLYIPKKVEQPKVQENHYIAIE